MNYNIFNADIIIKTIKIIKMIRITAIIVVIRIKYGIII